MASNSNHNTIYTSKYGSITLLNRTNYATWKPDIQAVLLAANAFDIVTGAQAQPAVAGTLRQDWIKRRGIALNLLYMSTISEIRNTLTVYLDNYDITGMWEHLKSLDLSKDAVYCLNQVRAFNLEEFDKATDTIESFAQRLIGYQLKLQDTEHRLTEAVMVMKLCLGMPADPDWTVTRLTVLRDNLTFLQAVARYQVAERLRPAAAPNSNSSTTESANTVSFTHNRGGNRRNKYRHRGGSFRGNSRRTGRNTGESADSNNKCYWCLRKGHIRKDCRDYARAMEKARRGRTLDRGDGVKETANVAISYSPCTSPSPSPRVEEFEDISAYSLHEISASSTN